MNLNDSTIYKFHSGVTSFWFQIKYKPQFCNV